MRYRETQYAQCVRIGNAIFTNDPNRHGSASQAWALVRNSGKNFNPSAWFAQLLRYMFSCLLLGDFFRRSGKTPVRACDPEHTAHIPSGLGAHPAFRNEWWYVTGWLETPDKKPLGFQITFFRVATEHDRENPSRFAPKQLIIAHAALSDPAVGKLLHDQKSAREGFGLAYTKDGNTDVKLGDWTMVREENGRYQTSVKGREFMLDFSLTPTQPPMLQDHQGFSRKGPRPEQASYYYSEPQLQVRGVVTRDGKEAAVNGIAWLDHEWFTAYLDPSAGGWDWVGANLDDGSALMAFQIRGKDGRTVWTYAGIRDASGRFTRFEPDQVKFEPQRTWRSPHTDATYPVSMRIQTGSTTWLLTPLMDDQELDSAIDRSSLLGRSGNRHP